MPGKGNKRRGSNQSRQARVPRYAGEHSSSRSTSRQDTGTRKPGPSEEQETERREMGGVDKTELTTSLTHGVDSSWPVPDSSTPDHCVLCDVVDEDERSTGCNRDVSQSQRQRQSSPRQRTAAESILLPTHDVFGDHWHHVKQSLTDARFSCCEDLESLITSYNRGVRDFRTLRLFFDRLEPDRRDRLFVDVLPRVAALACQLDSLFTQPIPALTTQKQASVTMSQRQVACVLANSFFCTLRDAPDDDHAAGGEAKQRKRQRPSERSRTINFSGLFAVARGGREGAKVAKLTCIMNYLDRMTADDRQRQGVDGAVTYSRRVLTTFPSWSTLKDVQLGRLHVTDSGLIDVDGAGMLQVDFANRRIGGGALHDGCVQEEIRFMVSPELIVARLLADPMSDNECLVVTGAERFDETAGYGDSFRWVADHRDATPFDRWRRRRVEVVAIDATPYRGNASRQFSEQSITREINKAFCGFYHVHTAAVPRLSAVASGNWGCGAYRGDHRLKALVQLMACAAAGRDLCYFTFGVDRLCDDIATFYEFVTERRLSVAQLWNATLRYARSQHKQPTDIFTFIMSEFPAPRH